MSTGVVTTMTVFCNDYRTLSSFRLRHSLSSECPTKNAEVNSAIEAYTHSYRTKAS